MLTNLRNTLRVVFDPEIREVAEIIRTCSINVPQDEITRECDKVFQERLKVNPLAFKMNFWENHFEVESLLGYNEISGRVLDFGCGSGHMDIILARRGMVIHGIDLSPIGISICNHLRNKESQEVQDRLTFSLANVVTDRPEGALFDSVWAAHVFEHIENPIPIFNGLRNWVKPGANILISVPLGYAYDDPSHVNHFFSGEELRFFVSNAIDVCKVEVNSNFNVIRALCRF